MAKLTYLGEDENSNAPVTWLGHTLKPGESVEVKHPHILAKAEGNPFFKVEEEAGEEDLPDENTPYGRGYYAKLGGKSRSIPVAYRGKSEAKEWVEGYDAAPDEAPEDEGASDGGTVSTGAQPGVPLAP